MLFIGLELPKLSYPGFVHAISSLGIVFTSFTCVSGGSSILKISELHTWRCLIHSVARLGPMHGVNMGKEPCVDVYMQIWA